ncbi:MAG: MOSC domain-containing protein [Porticoccaceae bacterium]|jgi:MOSC domain-containing protein YiiM
MTAAGIGEGVVLSIHIAAAAAAAMIELAAVRAIAGKGLAGDRYCQDIGTFSRWPGTGRAVTLIESEALAALPAECRLEPGAARRNLVTAGIALNDLVGVSFSIGGAVLRGQRLCDPCRHLENLTRPGVFAGLHHRGGLRADILVSGVISVGDRVLPIA